MIRVRGAALPQDYRLLSPQAVRAALPSFLFYKAKDALPEPATPPPLIPDPSPSASDSHSSWTLVRSSRGRRRCATACTTDVTLRGRWVGGGDIGNNVETSLPKGSPQQPAALLTTS